MELKKSEIILTFLVGFAASAITGGAPIVLLTLMTLVAAGALVWMRLDLTLKLPDIKLSRLSKRGESSMPQSAFVLGAGHQVGR